MKKIFAMLLCGIFIHMSLGAYVAAVEETSTVTTRTEHLKLPKKLAKKTPTNIVLLSDATTSIVQFNTMQLAFANDFTSKNAQVGDEIVFFLKEKLMTEEGSEILPEGCKVVAQIINFEKPKSFNRSGKIHLVFRYIETPDGIQYPLRAKLFAKNDYLSRGKLNAVGKGLSTTLAGMAVGTAAGCGIGIATGAVIVGGFAIGLPIGLAVGGTLGLVTPGLHYKAKAGDTINIQLVANVVINK